MDGDTTATLSAVRGHIGDANPWSIVFNLSEYFGFHRGDGSRVPCCNNIAF
jgi:hypothetical protein